MDATDVGQFNHRNVALEQGDREAPGVVFGSREQHSRFYDFHHENRGMALIFNHTKFDLSQNLLDRDGSDKDCADLVRVLEVMKFEVTPCINFTKAQVEKKLEDVMRLDHTESDCLVVIVMSHGTENGEVHAYDSAYQVSNLWRNFTGSSCPSLVGKPKLFFLQACRGQRIDFGVAYRRNQVVTDSRSNTNGEIFVIPTLADILIMYSTSPGFYSYRNINSGTWFIQELCKKLELHHESMNLLSILTLVIGSVAYGYQAETSDADTNAAKQLPHINSQLTKILHFGPIPDVSEEQKDEGEQREFTCDITRHYMWISIIFLIALCYALLVNYFVSRKE